MALVAAVSILDKERCNLATRGHFSARFFFTLVLVLIFKSIWAAQTKIYCVFKELQDKYQDNCVGGILSK